MGSGQHTRDARAGCPGQHTWDARAGCPRHAAGPALVASPRDPGRPRWDWNRGPASTFLSLPLVCPRPLGSHTDTAAALQAWGEPAGPRVPEGLAVGRGLLSGSESVGPGRPSFAGLVVTALMPILCSYHSLLRGTLRRLCQTRPHSPCPLVTVTPRGRLAGGSLTGSSLCSVCVARAPQPWNLRPPDPHCPACHPATPASAPSMAAQRCVQICQSSPAHSQPVANSHHVPASCFLTPLGSRSGRALGPHYLRAPPLLRPGLTLNWLLKTLLLSSRKSPQRLTVPSSVLHAAPHTVPPTPLLSYSPAHHAALQLLT